MTLENVFIWPEGQLEDLDQRIGSATYERKDDPRLWLDINIAIGDVIERLLILD